MPSLLDLQVNGFAGVDFNDPATTSEQVSRALEAMRRTGVTGCLPTLITDSLERFSACARTLVRHPDAAILGLHMEGPYISPEDGFRGAHPREHVRSASLDDFARRQEAAEGRIRLLTLAPEVPGALALIEHAVAQGVRVALGHTNATSAQIRDAASAGATLATHLGNGIAPLLPRHPNPIWDQLADDRLWISLIVDGHHLPPATVKAMVRAKGVDRVILVTDAIAAAACPPGRYRLGSLEVELDATGRVAVPGAVTLAGSALTLDRAVALVQAFAGIPPDAARRMAAGNPAAFLDPTPT
jgi:N-acetylglucosamine-6-phosphate deacetylase